MSKNALISLGIATLVIGGGLFLARKKTICIPLVDTCMLITSGDNIFNYDGVAISKTAVNVMEFGGYACVVGGGISLISGLVKPS